MAPSTTREHKGARSRFRVASRTNMLLLAINVGVVYVNVLSSPFFPQILKKLFLRHVQKGLKFKGFHISLVVHECRPSCQQWLQPSPLDLVIHMICKQRGSIPFVTA